MSDGRSICAQQPKFNFLIVWINMPMQKDHVIIKCDHCITRWCHCTELNEKGINFLYIIDYILWFVHVSEKSSMNIIFIGQRVKLQDNCQNMLQLIKTFNFNSADKLWDTLYVCLYCGPRNKGCYFVVQLL